MPDGSRECELILEQLRQMRDMHIAHAATVAAEIEFIKKSLLKIESIEASIEAMKLVDARQAGQIDGATWAFAKIGAVSVAVLTVIGWLMGGGWDRIKDILK